MPAVDTIGHFHELRGQVLILRALRTELPDGIARIFQPGAYEFLCLARDAGFAASVELHEQAGTICNWTDTATKPCASVS